MKCIKESHICLIDKLFFLLQQIMDFCGFHLWMRVWQQRLKIKGSLESGRASVCVCVTSEVLFVSV